MKSSLHYTFVQQVVDSDQAHSLVVGHESFYEDVFLILRQALFRVINRFIKAVTRESAFAHEPPQVVERGPRLDHCGEDRRIGRDYKMITQSALEPEARNAERAILVI